MKPIRCVLKKGKEKPLEGRHPWVFSGAIDQIDDGYQTGDIVKVFSAEDRFLGMGYLNPRSQIAVRMLSFDDVSINPGFFEKRIRRAVAWRHEFLPAKTDAFRVVNSEGDFLPGLIADHYAGYHVVQFLTAGMDRWKDVIVGILKQEFPAKGIFEKDDSEWRDWEGLDRTAARLEGEPPPDFVEILENGHTFVVDIQHGQKTGFFLDQRDNRSLVGKICAGKRLLNLYGYTGAFTTYAAAAGAVETVTVDTSQEALNTARLNLEKNKIPISAHQFVCEDVPQYLRSIRQEFDVAVVDPPAFCKHKNQIQQATRGYKDVNLFALKRLAPGGLLFTSSCSSYFDAPLFQETLFHAAKDARRNLQILAKTSHPFDHPVSIFHPEGEYLKSFLCLVE
ncbi:MAG: hypothetical protein A2Z83_05240 [Omnitrophica bacterium GWA2_52_8]|nr:MAG: hypothetical protein A2Z83_05240 [Omnitrophica bacterium GWA2_52_8]